MVRLPGASRWRPFDAMVIALAVATQVEVWVAVVPGPVVVVVLVGLVTTLPLLWRRKFPLLAPVTVFVALASSAFADREFGSVTTGYLAWLAAVWAVGAHNDVQPAIVGAAFGFATVAVATQRDPRVTTENLVNAFLVGGAVWLVALVLQIRASRTAAAEERATRLERDHDERARAAVADERARIARELHDVVAHSVSVMTVQAGAARMLLQTAPDRAAEPLLAVEEAGRQALAELRRLLGILRWDGAEPVTAHQPVLAPQPGLEDLPRLAATVREAGLPVEMIVAGEPRPLAAGIELTAYRIVQEALTNTLKHAGPARAHVTVRHTPNALLLEISDDGKVSAANGEGHGVVGMRERAALYGGDLQAGPLPGGGFGVRVRLPVEAGQP